MLLCKWREFFIQPPTEQPPTNWPTDHQKPTIDQRTIYQLYEPLTNRRPTNKKFEDQKNNKFIFEINYDFAK